MTNMFAKKPEDGNESGGSETPKPEPKASDSLVAYAAPSIPSLKIGRFQFKHGRLQVTPEEAELLDKLLAGASLRTRAAVTKIDHEAGEAVAQRLRQQTEGGMIRGGETSDSSPAAPKPDQNKA